MAGDHRLRAAGVAVAAGGAVVAVGVFAAVAAEGEAEGTEGGQGDKQAAHGFLPFLERGKWVHPWWARYGPGEARVPRRQRAVPLPAVGGAGKAGQGGTQGPGSVRRGRRDGARGRRGAHRTPTRPDGGRDHIAGSPRSFSRVRRSRRADDTGWVCCYLRLGNPGSLSNSRRPGQTAEESGTGIRESGQGPGHQPEAPARGTASPRWRFGLVSRGPSPPGPAAHSDWSFVLGENSPLLTNDARLLTND
jgi:hypothetical protein